MEANDDHYSLEELNQNYPRELLERVGIIKKEVSGG